MHGDERGGEDHARRVGRPERPLDPDRGPLADFAHGLRVLRAAAGYPSYRHLAGKALFSASVLSTAASGDSLPSLPVTLAYVGACGGDPGYWRRRWEAVAADLAGGAAASATPAIPARAPMPGTGPALTPAELPAAPACYVGRDREAALLLALTDPRNRSRAASVVISGLVGVGKSAFSLHVARRAAHDYPDGQLSLDVGASAVRGRSAHDMTGLLLGALGVPVPVDPCAHASARPWSPTVGRPHLGPGDVTGDR